MSARSRLALIICAAALEGSASGQIRLHPQNPHYFEFRGQPVVLITSGEHYGSVINGDFDFRRYLETLARDGLNYTRIFGGSYVEVPSRSFGIKRNTLAPAAGRFIAPWARSTVPGYEGGGNKFDLSQWNAEYFARYRDFLSEAAKHGIVVEITLFSSHYQEPHWRLSPFNPANNINQTDAIDWKALHTMGNGNILGWQERYARKLVREANEFDNVIFEIQNEPWSDRGQLARVVNPYLPLPGRDRYPNSIDVADGLSLAWQARVAQWIASEEGSVGKHHLIAQNYANFGFPVRELSPGVGVVNFHYAYPAAVEWNYGLSKAIAYDETGFLGNDDETYCRQAWNFMISGGGAFDALDYSFSVGHEDGTDTEPNGPGGGSAALRRQLGILAQFLHSFRLPELSPDAHTVRHAAGVYARALSSGAGEYAIYLDGNGPAAIRLELPAGGYAGAWTDIKTGATAPLAAFRHGGGEKTIEAPEFRGGIALRLRRGGK